ncbi:MAG: putative P-loop ATPase fused to an acetyltransferase [halophilic archaeon J07HX64]|nr:MAG: putative P-loop ATPase fused to an acetyltransferase [halophilic archaeon J07HX64]
MADPRETTAGYMPADLPPTGMQVAARLRREAVETDQRRVLVLAGEPSRTRERAGDALDSAGVDLAATTYLGPGQPLDCETLAPERSRRLLGTTRAALVVDCHERCEPNALGRVAGTVTGGGLLVLLVPPLESWPDSRDAFDETLAVPPFDIDDVDGHLRRWLVETLRAHRGVAIVDVDSDTVETDGLVKPAPALSISDRSQPHEESDLPGDTDGETRFPGSAYEACVTDDQRAVLSTLEQLRDPETAVVVESDRGRGKSSVAGLAAGSLAAGGRDVLVTAPRYRSCAELFARAEALLAACDALVDRDREGEPQRLETDEGVVRFHDPADAADLPGDPDRVFVDEAAAIPVGILRSLLDADGLAFTTTVHGYEGTGRGFSVRFREHLSAGPHEVTDVRMSEPIRYAAGDPVEVWSFRALALDASPPVAPLVADATPDTVTYRQLSPATLLADESLLRAVFGLLVLAHYQTEPNDLARLLDAPNVTVHALLADGQPVSVALLAREGGLSATARAETYEGGTVRGNLLPDLFASQLRDEAAAGAVGHRVLRIATHEAARSRGLGSHLLEHLRGYCTGDWFGVGFGATPRLVGFWRANGFGTVHLATSRDERSGEHSAIMLDPLSERGRRLHERQTGRLCRRLPAMLADPLSGVDPDVVRAVCRGIDRPPALDLTAFEWRIAAGLPHGAAVYDTAPRAVRRLILRHLVARETDPLDAREERLLVGRALQCRPPTAVAAALSYPSERTCMRAFGNAVGKLVEVYGTEMAREELERLR